MNALFQDFAAMAIVGIAAMLQIRLWLRARRACSGCALMKIRKESRA